MLTGHAEDDIRRAGGRDDLARGVETGGDGLLQLDVFVVASRGLDGLQAEVGEGADVDEIDIGAAAQILIRGHELAAPLGGELLAGLAGNVVAGRDAVTDIAVRAGVHVGDGAGADDADSHSVLSVYRSQSNDPRRAMAEPWLHRENHGDSTVIPRCFCGDFTVESRCFCGDFTVESRCFHGGITVFLR